MKTEVRVEQEHGIARTNDYRNIGNADTFPKHAYDVFNYSGDKP
jgi:hypothetical protein